MGMLSSDLSSAFSGIGYAELSAPFGFLLWLFFLSLSLKKADPQRWLQAWMYSGFAVFVGFILVIALPQKYSPPLTIARAVFWFVVFWAISFGRWSLAMSRSKGQAKQ